jgi:hypothetical protein
MVMWRERFPTRMGFQFLGEIIFYIIFTELVLVERYLRINLDGNVSLVAILKKILIQTSIDAFGVYVI